MPRRVNALVQLYGSARSRDLQGVLAALVLLAQEERHESGELPEWLPVVLRQWTLLERGVLQHGSTAGEQADNSAGELQELAAVLQMMPLETDNQG